MSTKDQRLARAQLDFTAAVVEAAKHGIKLTQHTDYQFNLRYKKYLVALYPSTQKVCAGTGHKAKRKLNVKSPWDLLDAVRAASKQWKTQAKPNEAAAVSTEGRAEDEKLAQLAAPFEESPKEPEVIFTTHDVVPSVKWGVDSHGGSVRLFATGNGKWQPVAIVHPGEGLFLFVDLDIPGVPTDSGGRIKIKGDSVSPCPNCQWHPDQEDTGPDAGDRALDDHNEQFYSGPEE